MKSASSSGKVVLSGASGMLGQALHRVLTANQVPCLQLLRREPEKEGQLQWNPDSEQAIENPAALEEVSAAIHLSGASVAGQRWTEGYKQELQASRIDSTRRLATVLSRLRKPPAVFLIASAIGIYGNRGMKC